MRILTAHTPEEAMTLAHLAWSSPAAARRVLGDMRRIRDDLSADLAAWGTDTPPAWVAADPRALAVWSQARDADARSLLIARIARLDARIARQTEAAAEWENGAMQSRIVALVERNAVAERVVEIVPAKPAPARNDWEEE